MSGESEAFESAVSRLPYPVFVVTSESCIRAMNLHARELWDPEQSSDWAEHPISQLVARLRDGTASGEEVTVLELAEGERYEVIHSTRSAKGAERWLMLVLRPLPTPSSIDLAELRRRWSLTPREAEIAAACIAGRSNLEIAEEFSITRETVKTHVARLLGKSASENRSQLIAKYLFG